MKNLRILALLFPLVAGGQSLAKPDVETIQFQSRLVGRTLPYHVILPAGYHQAKARRTRYPVLYLLHGLMGHYSDWITRTKLTADAAQYQIIIVTPEGNNGWYTDSATAAGDKYESYILQELIPDVERRFRTLDERAGRAVAGLSMGGYGALKFGVKYPRMFSFAASMSGALSVASWTEADLGGPGARRDSILQTYGAVGSQTRAANDLFRLVREMPAEQLASLPYFYFDCGTEDPLFKTNRAFADLVDERKIPHEYRELPGGHDWKYWDAQVREVLRIAAQRLSAPRAATTSGLKTTTAQPGINAIASGDRKL